MNNIYLRIKQLRKERGWSQEDLSMKVGYADKTMISKIESEKIDLHFSQLNVFAEAFGIDLIDFFADADDPRDGELSQSKDTELSSGVGYRIKSRRQEQGLKQSELAQMVGITRHLLYKYESGIVKVIPYDKLVALADALDVQPSYLAGWSDGGPDAVYMAKVNTLDQEDRETLDTLLESLLSKNKYASNSD